MEKRELTPKYDRHLERLLLTVQIDPTVKDKKEEFKRIYGPLLKAIPPYTKLEIVTSKVEPEEVKTWLKDLNVENRVRFHPTSHDLDIWSQDYAEALKVSGATAYLLPADLQPNPSGGPASAYDENWNYRSTTTETYHMTMIDALPLKQVNRARFFFEGGNVSFDKGPNGLRVFIGSNDIWRNIVNFQLKGTPKTVEEIKTIISEDFGGAEVIIMGDPKEKQHNGIFQIDQAFLKLDQQRVVMHKPTDPQNEVERTYVESLLKYKTQLEGLGYQVYEIPATCGELINGTARPGVLEVFASINAIPYVDKKTKEKCIIFPVFAEDLSVTPDGLNPLNPTELKGKGLAAYNLFLQLGYKPIPVLDNNGEHQGNTHCISNVLASVEEGTLEDEVSV